MTDRQRPRAPSAAALPPAGWPTSKTGAPGTTRVRLAGPLARCRVGLRIFVLMGASLVIVGVVGHFVGWALLATALGPTGYVFAAHPETEAARRRNALVGHVVAVGSGLFCLAVFGLWAHASIAQQSHLSLAQVGAAALSGALTVAILEILDTHHAPAGATALLIATGIARPGRPLYGLLVGLGMLILIGPPLSRWFPFARHDTELHA